MHFIDQLGRKLEINFPPQRIISIVPSQTELLFDLGLEDQIVGITKFCVHPPHFIKSKQKVGGTKNLQIEKMRSLKPDLIIANKEENEKEQIHVLENDFPVWISDVKNFDDALAMIQQVGEITNRKIYAEKLIQETLSELSLLNLQQEKYSNKKNKLSCIYLIWKNPFLTVGGDTFIHHQIEIAGFENMYKNLSRYPEISLNEMKALNPDIIFLSTEPYPFKESDMSEMKQIFKASKIHLVDGEMFSWYGSRMRLSFPYFTSLFRKLGAHKKN